MIIPMVIDLPIAIIGGIVSLFAFGLQNKLTSAQIAFTFFLVIIKDLTQIPLIG